MKLAAAALLMVLSKQACQQLVSNSAFDLALEGFLFVDAWISELELQQLDGV